MTISANHREFDTITALNDVVAKLPSNRATEVLQFALFLQFKDKMRGAMPLTITEIVEADSQRAREIFENENDERAWAAVFAATDDSKLQAWINQSMSENPAEELHLINGALRPKRLI